MSRWWRAYEAALNNPKLQRLPGEHFKAWFNLCCLASKSDGRLPDVVDIAFALRIPEKRATSLIEALKNAGLIDDVDGSLSMHDWDEHQYKSDSSAERVRRYREKSRNAESNAERNVTVTPQNRADTEQIQNRAEQRTPPAAAASPSPFDRFWERYPHKVGKGAARKAFEKAKTPIDELLLALDRYIASKPKDRPWCNPATWLNQERWSDQPADYSVKNGNGFTAAPPGEDAARYRRMMQHERDTGQWPFKTPRSEIPEEILKEFA